jgi:hypothetical protein
MLKVVVDPPQSQASVTLPVYPRSGVSVIVYVAVPPAFTVFAVGVAESEKSGPSTTLTVTVEELGRLDASSG